MKNFIKKHSVPIYFIIAFTVSWGGIILVIGVEGFMGKTTVSEKLMPLIYVATLLGPSLAGILLIGFVHGKAGYQQLWSRILLGRLRFRWYLIALLTAPLLLTVILFALMSASSSFLPGIFASDNKASLIITGILAGIMVGIFEELGWTGFVVPQIRQRFDIFKTGLMVGLLWGLWHMPLFMASVRLSENLSPVLYLSVLLFSFLPAYRVLMVWVYNHTRSLLIVILMHASLTASILILPPLAATPVQIVTYDLIFAVALWLMVVVTALTNKGRLS